MKNVHIKIKPEISVVMPMAGGGVRFKDGGFMGPKPLIELDGMPFFWWAIESLNRVFDIKNLTCVILAEHSKNWKLDYEILKLYPHAKILALSAPTAGALETAMVGVVSVPQEMPVVINDCDHAFDASKLAQLIANEELSGALCHFQSSSANYSYGEYDSSGLLVRTAEKNPISKNAIAGAYYFKSPKLVSRYYSEYREKCPYDELYISGIFDFMRRSGEPIRGALLDSHIPFGVPHEFDLAAENIGMYSHWKPGVHKLNE